jgi:hypothetical protein
MSSTVDIPTSVKLVFKRIQSEELQNALATLDTHVNSLRVGNKKTLIATAAETYLSLLCEVRRLGGDLSSLDSLDEETTLADPNKMAGGLTAILKFVDEVEVSSRYTEWRALSSSSRLWAHGAAPPSTPGSGPSAPPSSTPALNEAAETKKIQELIKGAKEGIKEVNVKFGKDKSIYKMLTEVFAFWKLHGLEGMLDMGTFEKVFGMKCSCEGYFTHEQRCTTTTDSISALMTITQLSETSAKELRSKMNIVMYQYLEKCVDSDIWIMIIRDNNQSIGQGMDLLRTLTKYVKNGHSIELRYGDTNYSLIVKRIESMTINYMNEKLAPTMVQYTTTVKETASEIKDMYNSEAPSIDFDKTEFPKMIISKVLSELDKVGLNRMRDTVISKDRQTPGNLTNALDEIRHAVAMMGDQEQKDWTERVQRNLTAQRSANSTFTPKAEPINKMRDGSKDANCYRCNLPGHRRVNCTMVFDTKGLEDKEIECEDCKTQGKSRMIKWTKDEQAEYAHKGHDAPKRCTECRARRKAAFK